LFNTPSSELDPHAHWIIHQIDAKTSGSTNLKTKDLRLECVVPTSAPTNAPTPSPTNAPTQAPTRLFIEAVDAAGDFHELPLKSEMRAGAAMVEQAFVMLAASEQLLSSSLVRDEDHAQDFYIKKQKLEQRRFKEKYRADVIKAVTHNREAGAGTGTGAGTDLGASENLRSGLTKVEKQELQSMKQDKAKAGTLEKEVVEAGSMYRQYRADFETLHAKKLKEWGQDSKLMVVYHHQMSKANGDDTQRKKKSETLKLLSHFGSCTGCVGAFGPCSADVHAGLSGHMRICCNYDTGGKCPATYTDCNPTMMPGQKLRLGLLWQQEQRFKKKDLSQQQEVTAQNEYSVLMKVVKLWARSRETRGTVDKLLQKLRRYEGQKGGEVAARRHAALEQKVHMLDALESLQVELKQLQSALPALHAHTPAPTPVSMKGCHRCAAAGQPCVSRTKQGVLSCDPPDPTSGHCPAGSTKCAAAVTDDAH
jgi:hypothetical protein